MEVMKLHSSKKRRTFENEFKKCLVERSKGLPEVSGKVMKKSKKETEKTLSLHLNKEGRKGRARSLYFESVWKRCIGRVLGLFDRVDLLG